MGDLQCSAEMMEEEEEELEAPVEASVENQDEEEEGEENVAPIDAEVVEIPPVAAAAEPGNVLSPSLAGQKRSRAADEDGTATGEYSPSKLRAAFVRGQRRRATRHSAVAE